MLQSDRKLLEAERIARLQFIQGHNSRAEQLWKRRASTYDFGNLREMLEMQYINRRAHG